MKVADMVILTSPNSFHEGFQPASTFLRPTPCATLTVNSSYNKRRFKLSEGESPRTEHESDYTHSFCVSGVSQPDYARFTTEDLKDLLKAEPERLFGSILEEVYRRDKVAKADAIKPTGGCCQSACFGYSKILKVCRKFQRPLRGDSHYMLQTPIEWECKYEGKAAKNPSIVADLFLSRNRALSYYSFVKRNISKMIACFIAFFLLGNITFPFVQTLALLFSTIAIFILSSLIPLFYISILKELFGKFPFRYIMGNAFVYIVGQTIILGDLVDGYLLLSFDIFWVLGFLILFSLDAMPPDILSNTCRGWFTMAVFFGGMVIVIYIGVFEYFEKLTGRTWTFQIGYWKTWDLVSVMTGCALNITLFVGRISYTSFTNPGYYTIIRSVVKQKSLKPEPLYE